MLPPVQVPRAGDARKDFIPVSNQELFGGRDRALRVPLPRGRFVVPAPATAVLPCGPDNSNRWFPLLPSPIAREAESLIVRGACALALG
jgi:hypothetical protein